MRDTLLVIHILAAGAWIGTNAVQFAVNPTLPGKEPATAADWHRTVVGFLRFIYMPAAIVSLITGVLLVTAIDETDFEMSDAFVSLGFLTVIVGSVLGMGFFGPQSRKAADAHEAGDTVGARAIENRIAMGGLFDTALVVVTVVAMVAKWGV